VIVSAIASMLYIPAGPGIDTMLELLATGLEQGDIIADGGNSYWRDSIRRHRRLARVNLRFADVGTSGGPSGARHGPCFMIGGEHETVALMEPVLHPLAIEQGYLHAGPPGTGHFAIISLCKPDSWKEFRWSTDRDRGGGDLLFRRNSSGPTPTVSGPERPTCRRGGMLAEDLNCYRRS
jgi:hypothetical protein